MSQQPEHLTGSLNVGTIFVEFDNDYMGGVQATTTNDALFGPVELGFDLTVTAPDLDSDEEQDNSTPEEQARKTEELMREALACMRLALARCFLYGKIQIIDSGVVRDPELEAAVEKVSVEIFENDPDYFLVTPVLTREALKEQTARDEAFTGFLEHMKYFVEAQQKIPDENITISEALDRQEKGAEQVRKVVDGDEK